MSLSLAPAPEPQEQAWGLPQDGDSSPRGSDSDADESPLASESPRQRHAAEWFRLRSAVGRATPTASAMDTSPPPPPSPSVAMGVSPPPSPSVAMDTEARPCALQGKGCPRSSDCESSRAVPIYSRTV